MKTWSTVQRGGNWNNSSNAGLGYTNCNNGMTYTSHYFSTRSASMRVRSKSVHSHLSYLLRRIDRRTRTHSIERGRRYTSMALDATYKKA